MLIVFSDGEENSSEHDLLDAIEAAQNSDVMVYAIRYTDMKHGKMDARDSLWGEGARSFGWAERWESF